MVEKYLFVNKEDGKAFNGNWKAVLLAFVLMAILFLVLLFNLIAWAVGAL